MISEIIWILWPIKMFFCLLCWKRDICVVSQFIFLWKVKTKKAFMLTKSPLLKLYISDSKYFLKLWLFTMGWKTVFFGVCVVVFGALVPCGCDRLCLPVSWSSAPSSLDLMGLKMVSCQIWLRKHVSWTVKILSWFHDFKNFINFMNKYFLITVLG